MTHQYCCCLPFAILQNEGGYRWCITNSHTVASALELLLHIFWLAEIDRTSLSALKQELIKNHTTSDAPTLLVLSFTFLFIVWLTGIDKSIAWPRNGSLTSCCCCLYCLVGRNWTYMGACIIRCGCMHQWYNNITEQPFRLCSKSIAALCSPPT